MKLSFPKMLLAVIVCFIVLGHDNLFSVKCRWTTIYIINHQTAGESNSSR
jgi:hypothetical protein